MIVLIGGIAGTWCVSLLHALDSPSVEEGMGRRRLCPRAPGGRLRGLPPGGKVPAEVAQRSPVVTPSTQETVSTMGDLSLGDARDVGVATQGLGLGTGGCRVEGGSRGPPGELRGRPGGRELTRTMTAAVWKQGSARCGSSERGCQSLGPSGWRPRVAEAAENHGAQDLKENRGWEEGLDFGISETRVVSVCLRAASIPGRPG